MHADDIEIDDVLVRRLLNDQFPELRDRDIQRVTSEGTVNVIYRLGDDLAVRLPRSERWVESLERELRWLPVLAPRLPLTIPEQVETGSPTEEYPLPWAIFRWIKGRPWRPTDLDDLDGAVDAIAEFVLALRQLDTTGAPEPGEHGRPLRDRDAAVRWALDAGADLFDARAATSAWERALEAQSWSGPPTWVHADLLPGNVLVNDGKVRAVVDFGTAHAGDPAMDVSPAWSLFDRAGRDRYRRLLDVDDATWERARGDAVANVVGVIYYRTLSPSFARECQARVEAALEDQLASPTCPRAVDLVTPAGASRAGSRRAGPHERRLFARVRQRGCENEEMYRPAANVVDDEAGWRILAASRAGHLITADTGSLDATFLPFLVDVDGRRVLAHFARANPQWRSADGARGLLIASGADAYISPSFYPSKRETGKVVPTWNYTVVHVHGVLRVHDDADWLRDLVSRLTDLNERGREEPWAITDAPAEFIEANLKAIVGVELVVERLEAKRKLSQNRSTEDIAGVVDGLSRGTTSERAVAKDMRPSENG